MKTFSTKIKGLLLIQLLVTFCLSLYSQESPTFLSGQDPKPEGKKWVIIENMSDEFDGETLDNSKWLNTDPKRWMGRAPGIFKKDVAKVEDGKLKLTVYQLDKPENISGKTWTHAGGYIGSKNAAQVGTYFEAKMKSSKTFMSSTFWVINNRSDGKGCDVRVTELDIQECIGQITNTANWAKNKYREMGSNTHSRNAVCTETPTGSKGNHIDLGGAAYDNYHIYAAWWKSAKEVLFFLDGKHVFTVTPPSNFNLPMYLRMVSETYDWVRTWKLESDVASSVFEPGKNTVNVYPNPVQNKITISGLKKGTLCATIYNTQGAVIKQVNNKIYKQFEQIDVSGLDKGIYLLKIQNEDLIYTTRFVKL